MNLFVLFLYFRVQLDVSFLTQIVTISYSIVFELFGIEYDIFQAFEVGSVCFCGVLNFKSLIGKKRLQCLFLIDELGLKESINKLL